MIRRALPLVWLGAVAAPAQAEPEALFELSVTRGEGAGSCPSGNEFERRVSTRLGRVPFATLAEQAIEVTLTRSEDGWHAAITLRDRDGIVHGNREIQATGSDCTPLAEATTLSIALTIDPNLPPSPSPSPTPIPNPNPNPNPNPLPPPCPACPPHTDNTPAKPEDPMRVAASLRGTVAAGLLPGVAVGTMLAAEAGPRRVRAELGLLYLPEVLASDPRFAFGLTAGSVGACAFPSELEIELGLCAELQLGAIHAVVNELQPLDPGDQLWFAATAGARVRFAGPETSFFELGGTAVVPILDRKFRVEGLPEPVFDTAPVGGIGFVGIGLHSP